MKSAYLGLGAFAGASLALMTTAALLWGDPPANREPSAARDAASTASQPVRLSAALPTAVTQRALDADAERLLDRLGRAQGQDDDERAAIERGLLSLGETAAPPLISRLRNERNAERQRLLLDLLRKLPGTAAEEYFVEQAREAPERSIRALAMDALADRKSDRALDALDRIATTDPEVLKRPFLTEPRGPKDDSTELPDEVTFTPRMKAMAALATTGDPRATSTLTGILHSEPEEALRMEAARNLGQLRSDPSATDALFGALTDRSAYVRLAALHSLDGVGDPRLGQQLTNIASTDSDLGVRALARRLLQFAASH
jgi:hypothetical protein